jgi:hypothetical protein
MTSTGSDDVLKRAYRKRKAGEDLSADERHALSSQQKQYAGRRTPLYCENELQLAEWQALAKADGFTTFSAWVVSQVKRTISGSMVDAVEHGRMEQRITHMEEEVEYHRGRNRLLEEENKVLRSEIRTLTSEIGELTQLISQRFAAMGKD